MGISGTPTDELHLKRNDAPIVENDLTFTASPEMDIVTQPISYIGLSDDVGSQIKQRPSAKRVADMESYTELLRTENERLCIEKERLVIEKERLAIEKQRLSVESELLTTQKRKLLLLESKVKCTCENKEELINECSYLQMLNQQ